MISGIVIKSTGSWYIVAGQNGDLYNCKLKGKFKTKGIKNTNPIAVGDRVKFDLLDDAGLISEIEERKNYIIRKSTKLSKQTHILATNIDVAFLVVSMFSPRTTTGFIDRFLVTAEAYSIESVLVFNKIDSYDQFAKELMNQLVDIYGSIGYKCIKVSALTGENMSELRDEMVGKTSLLAGHSGVGKSAIINCLDPKLNLKTGDVSAYHNKGMHTTTFAEMHKLDFGAYIIDTPGIKELGLIDFHKQELGHYYPEIRELLGECKFNNCTHFNEPGCAVKQAVTDGKISESRYYGYLNLLHDEEILDFENQYKE